MERSEHEQPRRSALILIWCAAGVLGLGLLLQVLRASDRATPVALPRSIAPAVPPLPPEAPESEPGLLAELRLPPAADSIEPARTGQSRPTPPAARSSTTTQPPTVRHSRPPGPKAPSPPKAPPRSGVVVPSGSGPFPLMAYPVLKPLKAFGQTIRGSGVVFVVDQSSSMIKLMPAVKQELGRALSQLTRYHRFNLIFFDDEMHYFEQTLVMGTRRNKERAWQWIKPRKAHGKTRALQAFMTATRFSGARTVVLLTDGALQDSEYRYITSYVTRRVRHPAAARDTPCLRLVPLNPEIGRDAKLGRLLKLIKSQPELAGS